MDSVIYVGDVGTEIILDCGSSVATATAQKILFKRPDKTTGEWVAEKVAGNANQIRYILQAGDVAVAGIWVMQAYVVMPGWTGKGKSVKVTVRANFE